MIKETIAASFRSCLKAGVLLMLASCASNPAHQEGLALVNQGRLEDALSKFEQANREEPENREFRIHYLNTRAQVIGRLLREAQQEKAAGRFAESKPCICAFWSMSGRTGRRLPVWQRYSRVAAMPDW